jgi:hypothetical protein
MHKSTNLRLVLAAAGDAHANQLELFALLTLGILESLENGLLSPAEAIAVFFNADNCRFVRERLPDKSADEVMSRGVQLSDLVEAIPPSESPQELRTEIAAIRRLCLGLLEEHRLVA